MPSPAAEPSGSLPGMAGVATDPEIGRAATTHLVGDQAQSVEIGSQLADVRHEPLGRRLEPVEHMLAKRGETPSLKGLH